jgi:hypothetical protein
MRKFSKKEIQLILNAQLVKEQVIISDAERDAFLDEIQKYLATDDYYWVKGCIWEVLRYMIMNPPEGEYKHASMRWILSEIKKIANKDL